jgi:hypothetical protein
LHNVTSQKTVFFRCKSSLFKVWCFAVWFILSYYSPTESLWMYQNMTSVQPDNGNVQGVDKIMETLRNRNLC